jgi:hypothetical protein
LVEEVGEGGGEAVFEGWGKGFAGELFLDGDGGLFSPDR